jgi:hypothetical protein
MCIPRLLYDDLRDRDSDAPEDAAVMTAAATDRVPEETPTAEEVLCNG